MPHFVRQQEIEHAIGSRGRFVLRVTSPDVEIRAGADETARVWIEFELKAGTDAEADQLFERVKYQVSQGAGSLEVSEPRLSGTAIGAIAHVLGAGSPKHETRIVVEVPRETDVSFNGVSGDLDVAGLRGRQDYRTVSGDVLLRDLAGEVRARGVSSDISMRADGTVRVEVNSVSGDVSLIAPRFESLRVATVSGDVEIEGDLARGEESRVETVSGDVMLGLSVGVTIEVRALSSDIAIGLPHRAEGSRDRRRFIVGDGAARLLFSSMSGDLIARSPRRASPIPPAPAAPPAPPSAPGPDQQLAILRALERGEITVDEATRRLGGTGSNG